jgi:hypothetical protein
MAGRSLLSYFRGGVSGPEATLLGAVDIDYALSVARKVASFGTYERGFRPAGTEAARRCAEFLTDELRRLGLPRVEAMAYPLDGWQFAGARVEAEGGPAFEAVAYGGASGTDADGLFGQLVDCGDGTAAAYAGVDVRGKIALVEMDLSALNWPGTALLEAAHQGAIGVVCWPSNHYAMMPGALHTHDLQVDCPVPMLNVSREDGRRLRTFSHARLFSSARLLRGATGRNVIGYIPGNEFPDEVVIIGDHYDAWFDGFMDDAVGVGAVVALARAAMVSGYRPRRTLAFVLHDAEEFGQADSPWDWCTGAFTQMSRLTPEWAGQAVGAVIFELCGFKAAPTYDWFVSPELATLADGVLGLLKTEGLYPEGARLHQVVPTWEDSFSYSAAGIPSAANLELPDFVRSHYYHTQFDTEELLDADKYALHVAGLGLLALRLDQATVPPLDFAARARHLRQALPVGAPPRLTDMVYQLERLGEEINRSRPGAGPETTAQLLAAAGVLNRGLTWIGGDGLDDTLYPHEQPYRDYQALLNGDLGRVTGMGWGRNVSYPVYRHQIFRHIDQPDRCWQWAGGRVSPYIDVWHALKEGRPLPPEAVAEALERLNVAYEHEARVLEETLSVLRPITV